MKLKIGISVQPHDLVPHIPHYAKNASITLVDRVLILREWRIN